MSKIILSVGFEVPGGEVEQVELLSDRSLLDADIILFQPEIPSTHGEDTYQGKRCLSDDGSFRMREAIAHWRRELSAAADAGKLVVVLLASPEVVYAATGRKEWSGTGRNARATRIVDELHAYSAIPTKWNFRPASGSEMAVAQEARFFSPYWTEFANQSQYRLYIEAEEAKPLVYTKSGARLVGAYVKKGRGALVGVPAFSFDEDDFIETREVDGKNQVFWTDEAEQFGKRLIATLVSMANSLASESTLCPPPEWVTGNEFRLPAEDTIENAISEVTEQMTCLEERRRTLEEELAAAGELRQLLFEQGKPLEMVVRRALQIMGFQAFAYQEGDSEFDVVFQSEEGRFIGEVEGRDNKAINIDKFSQLERNLSEDFAREEVDTYAKGVLFGNAYRLRPLAEREIGFTEKCLTAAQRLQAALVQTADLFPPARYLSEHNDPTYASACRQAILFAKGTIVTFPKPPGTHLAPAIATEIVTQ